MYLNTNKKIGVGILTYNRPDNFKQLLSQIKAINYIDNIIVVKNKNIDYKDIDLSGIKYIHIPDNIGIGACKNIALKYLIENNCEYLFLIEDDVIIKNSEVFNKYITTAIDFNIEHLNFGACWNNTLNCILQPIKKIVSDKNSLVLYKRLCGCFSFFTKNVIEKIGYFNEHYINSIEHIDHTLKISENGFYTPFHWFADIDNSTDYLEYSKEGYKSTVNENQQLYNIQSSKNINYFNLTHPYKFWNIPKASIEQCINFLKIKLSKK